MEIIKSYGFTFKTVLFVWVKKNKKATDTNFWGCGYYSRSNCEYLLLATRGKNPKVLSHSVHQVVELPVEEHSQKPTMFRDKIVELFGPELNVIEMFSRPNFPSQNYPNFTFVGAEFNNEDVFDSIERLKNL
jgi:N6-adenosine-specific RNA methylase IME4